jgi:beta-lactam-binding protein with PASTA domain
MNNLNPTVKVVSLVIMTTVLAARTADGQETALVKVPTLRGQQSEIARQTLRLVGLRAHAGTYYIASQNWRSDIGRSVVQMQTPQPGALMPEGGTVAFWTFAEAPKNAKVVKTPDVRKLPPKRALQTLADSGLAPMRMRGESEFKTDGAIVLDQYPRPGQPVFEGTSVHLRITKQ